MAIERFLGTRPQKAFLYTIIIQALVVLAMVVIVYAKVGPQSRPSFVLANSRQRLIRRASI